ncbi:hypothetical protein L7F22_019307 [Adiantum nelumboides]|nr:hypothetical protein [Adiantum nelumboides]
MKVTVSDWSAVGYWVWDVNNEDDEDAICGICQNAFDGVCGTCDEPGDQCPILFGKCTHIFHMHCIIRWTEKMQPEPLCPLCKRKWEEITAEDKATTKSDQTNEREQMGDMTTDMQENVPTNTLEGSLSMESEQ